MVITIKIVKSEPALIIEDDKEISSNHLILHIGFENELSANKID